MFEFLKSKKDNGVKKELLEFENKLSRIVPDYIFDPNSGKKYYTHKLIEHKNEYNILTGEIEKCTFWGRIILLGKQKTSITKDDLLFSRELGVVFVNDKLKYSFERDETRIYPKKLNDICERMDNND